jgi:hypothetical protein
VVEVAGFEKGRGFRALCKIVGAAVVQNQAVLDGPGGGVFGGGGNSGLRLLSAAWLLVRFLEDCRDVLEFLSTLAADLLQDVSEVLQQLLNCSIGELGISHG